MLEHINTGQVPCEGTSSLASYVCIIFCNSNIFLQHLPIYKSTINNNNVFITFFYVWVRYQIPKKKKKKERKKIPFHLSTHLYIASLLCFPVHTCVIYSRHTDFGLKERFFVSTKHVTRINLQCFSATGVLTCNL